MSAAVAIPHLLDCRRVAGREHPRLVLEAFDRLGPGESVRVACSESPREALAVLQRDRAGAFDWSPLREGPAEWLVEVERRKDTSGARREITEALAWDHARLDGLEEAAFEARGSRRFADAGETFAFFTHGLRRHIDFEEHLVFPEFEARSGIVGEHGPTAVMRAEHRAIASILAAMEKEIADPEAPVELSRLELRRILHDHDLKEEQVLYPAIDRLLTEDESDGMVARIQSWTRG